MSMVSFHAARHPAGAIEGAGTMAGRDGRSCCRHNSERQNHHHRISSAVICLRFLRISSYAKRHHVAGALKSLN